MFSLTAEETLIQSGGVLNTIAPTHLPPRLSLVPLDAEEEKEDELDYFHHGESKQHCRLRTMQRAHRRTTRLTMDGWQMETAANSNRIPFHTNNPYVHESFWSYLLYNLTDPCCGTSEYWIYDAPQDYDGDLIMEDVDVDDNGLFWREYNPKRELYDLQLQAQDSTISARQRSYLEKKIEHLQRRDPLEEYFAHNDHTNNDTDNDSSRYRYDGEEEEDDMDVQTLLTMDESLAEGNMSAMEVAVRKYKQFEREQRFLKQQKKQQKEQYHQQHYYFQQEELGKTYSF